MSVVVCRCSSTVCMHAVVDIDTRGGEVVDAGKQAAWVTVCACVRVVVAVDMNTREVERWGS